MTNTSKTSKYLCTADQWKEILKECKSRSITFEEACKIARVRATAESLSLNQATKILHSLYGWR